MKLQTTRERRKAALLPGGVPRYVRCYAMPPETHAFPMGSFDRFTVVFTGRAAPSGGRGERKQWPYVGLSGHGFTWDNPCDRPRSGHLGKRVPFSAMPERLQAVAMADYLEIWGLQ